MFKIPSVNGDVLGCYVQRGKVRQIFEDEEPSHSGTMPKDCPARAAMVT